jgi:hypothetical protein
MHAARPWDRLHTSIWGVSSPSVTLILGEFHLPCLLLSTSPSPSFLQHERQLSEHDSCSVLQGRKKGDDGTSLNQQSLVIYIIIESRTTKAMGSNGRDHRRGVPRPPPLPLYRDWEEEEVVKAGRRRQSPLAQSSTSPAAAAGVANKKRLSKQLSMKETTREVKWEKRKRQIQRQRSSMRLSEADDRAGGSTAVCPVDGEASSSAERVATGITDGDLDELRGSMDLGFRFDEQKGGQDLCDTLPALDFYFAVNRQVSEPRMSFPTSTSSGPSLSATKSSPNLCGTLSPGSPGAHSSNALESWKICNPGNLSCRIFFHDLVNVVQFLMLGRTVCFGIEFLSFFSSLLSVLDVIGDNPQLVKTRLRHWAQVVACSVKHSS